MGNPSLRWLSIERAFPYRTSGVAPEHLARTYDPAEKEQADPCAEREQHDDRAHGHAGTRTPPLTQPWLPQAVQSRPGSRVSGSSETIRHVRPGSAQLASSGLMDPAH